MHGILREKKTNEFRWTIGFDTGMSPGSYFIANIEELQTNRKLQRCFYFEENSEEFIHRFINRVKNDSNYRELSFSSKERWHKVSKWYEKNSWALFVQNPLKKNGTSDEMFHKLFVGIKANVELLEANSETIQIQNNSQHCSIDIEIFDIITELNRFENVKTKFSCRGVWHLIPAPFDKTKLMIPQENHMPYAHVSFTEIPAEQEPQKNFSYLLQTQ